MSAWSHFYGPFELIDQDTVAPAPYPRYEGAVFPFGYYHFMDTTAVPWGELCYFFDRVPNGFTPTSAKFRAVWSQTNGDGAGTAWDTIGFKLSIGWFSSGTAIGDPVYAGVGTSSATSAAWGTFYVGSEGNSTIQGVRAADSFLRGRLQIESVIRPNRCRLWGLTVEYS